MIKLNTAKTAHSAEEVGQSMTAGDLIDLLLTFNEDEKIVLSFDDDKTFGGIEEFDFEEI